MNVNYMIIRDRGTYCSNCKKKISALQRTDGQEEKCICMECSKHES